MKYLVYFFTIIILLGLNLGLFNSWQIGGQFPNFLLLLTIFFALEKKDFDFYFIAFFSGLFLDFYYTGFFGAYTFSLITIALGLHLLANRFLVLELNWKSLTLLLLGSLIVFNFLLFVYGFITYKIGLSGEYENIKAFSGSFPQSFFYNWLLLYPMYLFSQGLKNFIDNWTVRSRGIIR
jgi:rod shape-determining protein MreD